MKTGYLYFILIIGLALSARSAAAAESLCATVKMEISQELTLERQAFDAHMRINNGIESMSLTGIRVDVKFTDATGSVVTASSDPNATNAFFFIKVDTMSNITDVDGAGTVAPSTSADIHWLIIPTPGAGGSNTVGMLYYVGAKLKYTLGGTEHEMDVTPDYIYVKPLPNLALDYFLPGEVYGDDAFTTNVEASVPYSLGIRVKNIGYGTAYNLKLDSCQPEIKENTQGLLIGFQIESSEVMGQLQSRTLLVDFGNIAGNGGASLARWIMTSTLSGTFTNFTASVSHADELGGQLTSLIQSTNLHTHMLVHDVLVDLDGRDAVIDYLAGDKVYESSGFDSSVTNVSALAQLDPSTNDTCTLSISQATTGCIYLNLTNSAGTNMVLKDVVRSDGKKIKAQNAWLSKSRQSNPTNGWYYFFNLFDVNASNYTYAVSYETVGAVNRAPQLQYISPKAVAPGKSLSFEVVAVDPDGTTPALSSGAMPVGATFVDNTNGTGSFAWTPSENQAGDYRIKFTAFDGQLASSQTVSLRVGVLSSGSWPAWWETRGVLKVNATTTNDYGAVNQGQLKHIAEMAWYQLKSVYGTDVAFSLNFSNMNNYAVVNAGQLKSLATPFYDLLISKGYTNAYPWANMPVTNDFAIVNIGQVKRIFNFDP